MLQAVAHGRTRAFGDMDKGKLVFMVDNHSKLISRNVGINISTLIMI
jgi:hypothetical protein